MKYTILCANAINFKNLFETKNYPEQLNESFEINFTNLFI